MSGQVADQGVAVSSVRNDDQNGLLGAVFVGTVGHDARRVCIGSVLSLVPVHHPPKSIVHSFMHATPFLAVHATRAPERRAHAIPLVVDPRAGIPRVGHVPGGDGIGGRDGISRSRGHVRSIRNRWEIRIEPAQGFGGAAGLRALQCVTGAGALSLARRC